MLFRSLGIENGELVVVQYSRQEQRRAPVDAFFRALADAYGSRSVAVVLSGTGPNGSAGLKRVKEYGGLVIVQDPETGIYNASYHRLQLLGPDRLMETFNAFEL